jgi:hypothetical protein
VAEQENQSDLSESAINSIDITNQEFMATRLSPINFGDSGKMIIVSSKSPINFIDDRQLDQTTLVNSDSSITSKEGELSQELDKAPSDLSPVININLEQTPVEKSRQFESLQTSIVNSLVNLQKSQTSINNEISSANPSMTVNDIGINNSQNLISAINESKQLFSNIENITQTAASLLNLPSINEISKLTDQLIDTSNSTVISNMTAANNLFKNNSNLVNTINQVSSNFENKKNSTPTNITEDRSNSTLNSTNVESTSYDSMLKSESNLNTAIEQKMPTVSKMVEKPDISQETTINKITSNPALNTASTSVGQNNSTVNVSNVTPSVSQPTSTEKEKPVEVNIDLNQLVNSISRLERILLGGIEVSIKEL